ncbi:MAG: hypothetical protein JSW03_00240 [Candidatus Eiseniibacteriota bacterium]|nr:MAG: hypothetical protein JSW03_00240 [Candidatus Eisenbacteria bacterium]
MKDYGLISKPRGARQVFMRAHRLILLLVGILLFPGAGEADWQVFTADDGLGVSSVTEIVEDGFGSMWFTNFYNWVSRYDGVSWNTWTTGNSHSFHSIYVDNSGGTWLGTQGLVYHFDGEIWARHEPSVFEGRSIEVISGDESGNMWFAFYGGGGVVRYDGTNWTKYTRADGLASNEVRTILQDSSGNMWFGTEFGVSRFDGVTWTTYTTADGLAHDQIHSMLEDNSGNLWLDTTGGVSRFDGTSWTGYTTADGLVSNDVRAMTDDSSGNMWFATWEGVSRFDGLNWTTYTTIDGLVDERVKSAVADRDGHIWFGTMMGVSRFDGSRWRTYTTVDGLHANDVHVILEDSFGNLWFGSFTGGASRYDKSSFKTYRVADGLGGQTVGAAAEDGLGNLWFGTGGGASRFDGLSWQTYTTADGLGADLVREITKDSSGNLWFGTGGGGVTRYDGLSWQTYTTADGLAHNAVWVVSEDSQGNLWFAYGLYGAGVTRYDGVSWTTYTTADGLAGNTVWAILEDSQGNLWFAHGTQGVGVSRFDGTGWTNYRVEDGLASNFVFDVLEDNSESLWFGTGEGVTRYDGTSWISYSTSDGLAHRLVQSVIEDQYGNLWFGTFGGVTRYDGDSWGTYATADGLGSVNVNEILEDSAGDLWFGTSDGVTRHEPDRVHPQTVISPRPPELSTSTTQIVSFAAAFRDNKGITYSHSFNGTPWSNWSPVNFWQVTDLADGVHTFMVRARDKIGNIDSTAAVSEFEIDAAPPVPVIASPGFGEAVRDSVVILGTASDLRFEKYRVEVHHVGSAAWDLLLESNVPVSNGVLAGWNTLPLPDGDYEIRLSVTDALGLTGTYLVRVIVDNHAPWVYETAPAIVSVVSGGSIYTTNGNVHLYFPPRAFAQDTEVRIDELDEGEVPDTLESGAVRFLSGHEISWSGASLAKPAMLDMHFWGLELTPSGGALSLYVFGADSTWRRLGGTVDALNERISSPITNAGRYAVFAETAQVPGVNTLSALSVTPRVFSPSGGFANAEAAIGFALGRAGAVTVKVYNRAGRLVREVISGAQMGAGANLVRWDGRDRDGVIVEDGLYLVSVEALGEKQVKTIAVVR